MRVAVYCFDFGGTQCVSHMTSRPAPVLICEDEKRLEMSLEKGDVNHRLRGFSVSFFF